MKKLIQIVLVSGFFVALPLLTMAQTPPPPNGGSTPGSGNTPVGGGAPIDGGITMLLILGAAYGGRKIFRKWN
jgi:hypothetical protein